MAHVTISTAIDLSLPTLAARRTNLCQGTILDAHIEANDGQTAEEEEDQRQIDGHMEAKLCAPVHGRFEFGFETEETSAGNRRILIARPKQATVRRELIKEPIYMDDVMYYCYKYA